MASPFFTSRVPQSLCPHCGASMDVAAAMTDVSPKPEDFTLCVRCGGVAVFTDELMLRGPTQAELQIAESMTDLVRARSILLQTIELYRRGRWANYR